MNVARPHVAVSPGVEGEALVVLARTTAPLTGRQIARLARRGTSASVSAALDRLVAQGLVQRQHAGRRLRDTLERWQPSPLHASMFGSAARGDGDAGSDIDLLIIRPGAVDEEDAAWRQQVDQLSQAVLSWTGNHAGILELAERDFDSSSDTAPSIVTDLEADGIDLAGLPFRALLRERR
jgi:predicted nucleotidyltransferase